MKLNKQTILIFVTAIAAILLISCSPLTATETKVENIASPANQTLKTTMGDFVITSSLL